MKKLIAGALALAAVAATASLASLALADGDDPGLDPTVARPGEAGMCAPGTADCTDTSVTDGTDGPPRGIAVGEPNPSAPGGFKDPVPDRGSQGNGRGDTGKVSGVQAPIEAVELVVRKSLPPQYAILIRSGLPNGCTSFDGIKTSRDGNVITATVWNRVRDGGGAMACDMVYGTVENIVELGQDFTPGETYVLVVNDHRESFVAR